MMFIDHLLARTNLLTRAFEGTSRLRFGAFHWLLLLSVGCAPSKAPVAKSPPAKPVQTQAAKSEPRPKPQLPLGTKWVDKSSFEMAVKRWKEPDGRPRVINVLHALDFRDYNSYPEVRDVQVLTGNVDDDQADEIVLRVDMAGGRQMGASGDDRCYMAVLDPFNEDPQKLVALDGREFPLKDLGFQSSTTTSLTLSLKKVHSAKVVDLIIEQFSKITTGPQDRQPDQSTIRSVEVLSYDQRERIVRFSWEHIAQAGQEDRKATLPRAPGDRISIVDASGRVLESYAIHPTSQRYVLE